MDSRQRQYQKKQNTQRKAGNRQRREKVPPWFLAMSILLILNLVFFIHLQSQIKDIKNTLNQVIQGQTLRQDHSMASDSVQPPASTDNLQNLQTASGSVKGAEEEDRPQNTQPVNREPEEDYVTLCGLTQVDKPVKRNKKEILQRLEELSGDSELIKEIYDNAQAYPEKMLEALANNPEMADFVAGYLTSDSESREGFTDSEKEQEYPLFLQWDPRWGYAEYGDYSNVGMGGCGPTCLSMVMYYLLEDDTLTPDFIAGYSMENGYYVQGTGTAWALLQDFPSMYGINVEQLGKSEELMKAALDQGMLLICSMGPGDFTTGGHFIVIYGYDRNGFKVNDSNCVARSRRRWTYDEIESQIKQVWAYGTGSRSVRTVTTYGGGNVDYPADTF